jgi:glycine cleavage system H protein
MDVNGFEMKEELYYTKLHTWARIEDDVAVVGLDPIGIALAGKVSFVRVKKAGMMAEQDKPLGTMEAGKGVVKLPAPVSGEIIEVNPILAGRELDALNTDPYGEGWIAKVRISNSDEVSNLLTGSDMLAWAETEAAKVPQ